MYFISKNRKMMSYFEQESNKNLALVTSYRIRIDDHGDPINDVQSTQRLYSEDTQLNGIFLGDWMLRVGQNIIGEPTTTLFRKSFLTEPFGTLKGREYACSVDMASWISLLSKGDAVYISESLSQFRHHAGQQIHNKLLQGCEDFTHLVVTSKEYGFYKILQTIEQLYLAPTNGAKVLYNIIAVYQISFQTHMYVFPIVWI